MNNNAAASPQRRFGCLQVLGIVLLAVILAVGATVWVVHSYIFPGDFKPVVLSRKEESRLNAKLAMLNQYDTATTAADRQAGRTTPSQAGPAPLQPERYSESGANRDISFTEKELNALLAKNTDLATKLAIDLADDLISAKLLVPVDQDFPVLGGQIIKVRAGLELAFRAGKPVVVLKGISLMGVPIPGAWLGGLKNVDLIQQYSAEPGFWQAFAAGVDELRVEEGRLWLTLKE